MQQQIQVNATLTYSANAELSADQLREAIRADVARLLDPDDTLADIDLVHIALSRVREERHIYGTDDTAPDLLDAARAVVAAWVSGDLAAAVRNLDSVLQETAEA